MLIIQKKKKENSTLQEETTNGRRSGVLAIKFLRRNILSRRKIPIFLSIYPILSSFPLSSLKLTTLLRIMGGGKKKKKKEKGSSTALRG